MSSLVLILNSAAERSARQPAQILQAVSCCEVIHVHPIRRLLIMIVALWTIRSCFNYRVGGRISPDSFVQARLRYFYLYAGPAGNTSLHIFFFFTNIYTCRACGVFFFHWNRDRRVGRLLMESWFRSQIYVISRQLRFHGCQRKNQWLFKIQHSILSVVKAHFISSF